MFGIKCPTGRSLPRIEKALPEHKPMKDNSTLMLCGGEGAPSEGRRHVARIPLPEASLGGIRGRQWEPARVPQGGQSVGLP
ncbi:hypothetical protein AVEN_148572-1, partial [Araneus ventricosus]